MSILPAFRKRRQHQYSTPMVYQHADGLFYMYCSWRRRPYLLPVRSRPGRMDWTGRAHPSAFHVFLAEE
jgi:hypothetical protein